MDRTPQPPWYRLHFVTWLAILVVGGGLGWGNFKNVRKQFTYQRSSHLGWPLVAGVVIDKSNRKTRPVGTVRGYRWRKFGSIFDVTVAVLILGSTGFAVERRFRAEMRWQIRVTTLLSATAVVAAALCCAQDGRAIFFRLAKWVGEPSPLFVDISFRSWAVKLPILFGLACTKYVLGRMNIWFIGLALRWGARLRRSAMHERAQPFDVGSPTQDAAE
jgi:hypothetical protein